MQTCQQDNGQPVRGCYANVIKTSPFKITISRMSKLTGSVPHNGTHFDICIEIVLDPALGLLYKETIIPIFCKLWSTLYCCVTLHISAG